MRPAVIISLGASGVLGIAALVVARVWLPSIAAEQAAAERSAPGDVVAVVAAKEAIPAGARLEADKLVLVRLPADAVPLGAYSTIDAVVAREGGAPVALAPLARREAILPGRISDAGAKPSVAAVIAPGKRAFTIRVDAPAGGGGHILPGDRVDVLLSRQAKAGFVAEGARGAARRADLVAQNVRVLAMNFNANLASTEKDRDEPKTATLEVGLQDAGRLALAAQAGDLSLALRRVGAGEEAPLRPILTSDLGGRYAGAAPAAAPRVVRPRRPEPRPAAPSLVVVNGDEASTAPPRG